MTLSVEQKAEDQFFLARHDSDAFSRWQAFNTLLTDALIAAFRKILGGKPPVFASDLTDLAGSIAGDETLEPAYRALALSLPGEADIAREIGKNIDPDAIFATREALALGDRRRPTGECLPSLYDAWPTRPLQPRCGERRTTGAAQRAARLSRAAAGRSGACRPAFPVGDQHDRPCRRADRACASPPDSPEASEALATSRRDTRAMRWSWTNGSRSRPPCRARNRRHGPGADRPSGLLDGQSQPGALADRHLLQRQPDRLPPSRRRRLPVFRARPCSRSKSAIRKWRQGWRRRCARGVRSNLAARPRRGKRCLSIANAENLSADLRDIVERTLA